MNLNPLSRKLYRAARATRDANAILRGPKPAARRIFTRFAYRETNKLLARALRSLFK